MGNRGGRARRNLARRVAGGGGPVGEKQEGLKNYLWVVLGCEEALGGGGSTAATAALRRGKRSGARSESTSGAWGIGSRARLGWRETGEGSSAGAGAAATMAAALMEAGSASGAGSGNVRVKELLEV